MDEYKVILKDGMQICLFDAAGRAAVYVSIGIWSDPACVELVNFFSSPAGLTDYRKSCTPEQIDFLKGIAPAMLVRLLEGYDEKVPVIATAYASLGDAPKLHAGSMASLLRYYATLGFTVTAGSTTIESTVKTLRKTIVVRPEHAALLAKA